MEEYVLYVQGLESLLYEKKEQLDNIVQLTHETSKPSRNAIYLREERKLYLRSVAFGTMEFQFVLLDFEYSRITFKRAKNSPGDANHQISKLLSTLQLDFQPNKMSFVMERRAKQNNGK